MRFDLIFRCVFFYWCMDGLNSDAQHGDTKVVQQEIGTCRSRRFSIRGVELHYARDNFKFFKYLPLFF